MPASDPDPELQAALVASLAHDSPRAREGISLRASSSAAASEEKRLLDLARELSMAEAGIIPEPEPGMVTTIIDLASPTIPDEGSGARTVRASSNHERQIPDDNDAELQRAVQMSMALNDGGEDAELQRAVEMSMSNNNDQTGDDELTRALRLSEEAAQAALESDRHQEKEFEDQLAAALAASAQENSAPAVVPTAPALKRESVSNVNERPVAVAPAVRRLFRGDAGAAVEKMPSGSGSVAVAPVVPTSAVVGKPVDDKRPVDKPAHASSGSSAVPAGQSEGSTEPAAAAPAALTPAEQRARRLKALEAAEKRMKQQADQQA